MAAYKHTDKPTTDPTIICWSHVKPLTHWHSYTEAIKLKIFLEETSARFNLPASGHSEPFTDNSSELLCPFFALSPRSFKTSKNFHE